MNRSAGSSKTWYRLDRWLGTEITPVDVVKETPQMVVFIETRWGKEQECRAAKVSSDSEFHKTLDEAKAAAKKHIEGVIKSAEMKIERAKSDLERIMALE